ncbi:MAG: DUF882 domain-containing protein [Akkermansiaceae bacterium]|nr:DUF882 domain-containing protein [Akkermansiaceae bacterium]
MILKKNDSDTTLSQEITQLDRRRVISGLGLASLGLIASSGSASAFLTRGGGPKVNVVTKSTSNFGKANPQIDLSELPSEWTQSQGNLLTEYVRYINSLKLKSITPLSVVQAHAKSKGSVWNTLPPKMWWSRIGLTLRVVDRVAQEMNIHETEIISAYRSPAYNSRCSGARANSWHQANVAVDVKFPVRASLVTATARNLRDRGLFKGGVGGYGGFTHIDTRGENVNW